MKYNLCLSYNKNTIIAYFWKKLLYKNTNFGDFNGKL